MFDRPTLSTRQCGTLLAGWTLLASCAWDGAVGPTSGAETAVIHAGNDFACALGRDRKVWCWGWNAAGQLGNGTIRTQIVPAPISSSLTFESLGIHGAGNHACAVATGGDVYCWGDNRFGQLGDGTLTLSTTPVQVEGGLEFRSVSAGWRFTCGITVDDQGYCWGRGVWGQLGDGLAVQSSVPVPVAGDLNFGTIEVGANNLACGVSTLGAVYCWGLDWNGSLGTPGADECESNAFVLDCATTPTLVELPAESRDVAVGQSFACAVIVDGRLYCWGTNNWGQLGQLAAGTCVSPVGGNDTPCTPRPSVVPGLPPLASVSAGSAHTCAVTTDGAGYCWGRNRFGELGNGNVFSQTTTPTRVRGELVFATISAGLIHTCGATGDGGMYCWGSNDRGQIGDGTARLALVPSQVRDDTGVF